LRGRATAGTHLAFGEFGLATRESHWITARQIEATRVIIVRALGHEGRLWIRVFPDKPISKKPLETRMGKGKGDLEAWVAPVRRGRVLFELAGVSADKARRAFTLATHKLPVATKMITAGDGLR
jgi:large subunit ribosomal protein L16